MEDPLDGAVPLMSPFHVPYPLPSFATHRGVRPIPLNWAWVSGRRRIKELALDSVPAQITPETPRLFPRVVGMGAK
jgi:hypothetical protein